MQRMNLILGETRYVRLQITLESNPGETLQIRNSAFTLIAEDGETEATGECTVIDDVVMALISPKKVGRYKVMISYDIGYESLIEAVEVAVI